MKKGESLQLNYAWWDKGRPPTMKSTGLGAALKEYEKWKKQNSHLKALQALAQVDAARQRAIALCTGALFPDTKAALQRHSAIANAVTVHENAIAKRIAAAQVRVTDMQKHMANLPKEVKAYNKLTDDKQKTAKAKQIQLNHTYLRNAINGAVEAMDALHRQEKDLQQYNDLFQRYSNVRTQYSNVLQPARDLVTRYNEFAE